MSDYANEREPGLLTEESVPVVTGVGAQRDAYPPTGRSRSAPDDAQSKAADVKDSAKEAGQHVADVAKDQASNVAAEAKHQAKDLVGQGKDELRQQAAQQQERVAGGLHSLSDELHAMARGSTDQGVAADLAREAADRTRAIATWLEQREPGDVLEEVRSFARRRPGAFLGIAAAAGVLVGRLGRGLKEGEPEPARPTGSQHRQPVAPRPTGADPMTQAAVTDPAYGRLPETGGYGSTVADPVIDTGSGQGRTP